MTNIEPKSGFVPGTTQVASHTTGLALSGLTLSVKDIIDVAGLPTGAGNPLWRSSHEPPLQHAEVVTRLLDAGAAFVGKTQTDELAYSLFGTNQHYGTPPNPQATDRVPGGSSSGAASTVAAGAADIGLGTDTAGSIRVPAGWCGLVGFRPSHSRVSRVGIVPLAPSFDVPGLITRDLATMRRVLPVLLSDSRIASMPQRLWLPQAVWTDELRQLFHRPLGALRTMLPEVELRLPPTPTQAFITAQSAHAWRAHGSWITAKSPSFGPGITARFEAASRISESDVAAAVAELEQFKQALSANLVDTVLVLPTTLGPAPFRDRPVPQELRSQLLPLTTIAPICGLPGLSLPLGQVDGAPMGLCLLGAAGSDEAVLSLADQLYGPT